jgi:hypothetical protein
MYKPPHCTHAESGIADFNLTSNKNIDLSKIKHRPKTQTFQTYDEEGIFQFDLFIIKFASEFRYFHLGRFLISFNPLSRQDNFTIKQSN